MNLANMLSMYSQFEQMSSGTREQQSNQEAEKPQKRSWGDYFTEPIETIYIQMHDNEAFKYTSHDEEEIDLNTQALQSWLKRVNQGRNKNYNIENIKLIIHNHLNNFKFSERDYRTHRDLKQHGFNGHFMLYSNPTKQTYFIDKIEKNGIVNRK